MLRYVESDSVVVREDLVGFTECDTGISGQNLADKITTFLEVLGLDLSNHLWPESCRQDHNFSGRISVRSFQSPWPGI